MNSNKGKAPTNLDRLILQWLKSGQSIDHISALQRFKTTALRDSIYRLVQNNEPITAQWNTYTTAEGKTKKYKRYFITPPEILPAN